MSSKNASSAGNQQERSIRNLEFQKKFKNLIIAIGLLIMGYFLQEIVFNYLVDPLLVPLIGMRPVLAVITLLVFTLPGLIFAKNNPHF